MSWMLPALVPGLLIAATFGLDRLESRLRAPRAAPDSQVRPPRHGDRV
ncbi:MAG TPA: hypothetical protein VK069_09560 [Mycolicibacillus parakoreensis]|uniref:Uncharacterized protein n=1 Tax=Mycolicibacillus parakoreensis TaxID=1069221 RepID=A0ABY3U314_9MYCO|nr:hypothetical protein [Mycolicibacillus parakoreensis]ULN53091.1 hypothetical protein MIU77_01585 [Mycolicibacillus parakoreensis]HLR99830.1 hypothetical protein [Mycolicibacillus parakoreensis]